MHGLTYEWKYEEWNDIYYDNELDILMWWKVVWSFVMSKCMVNWDKWMYGHFWWMNEKTIIWIECVKWTDE